MSSDGHLHYPAVRRLLAFFREMQSWETEALRRHDAVNWETITQGDLDRLNEEDRQTLSDVFANYVVEGAAARRVREPLHFGSGTTMGYNGVEQPVVSLAERGKGAVFIETRPNDGLQQTLRYELVERDGAWKIRDNRKIRLDGEQKWKSFTL